MLSRTAVEALPSVEDWITQSLAPSATRQRMSESIARARVRAIYFEIGRGSLTRLSSDDAKLVRIEVDASYARYRSRAIVESRVPLSRASYAHLWRKFSKGIWRREALSQLKGRLDAAA